MPDILIVGDEVAPVATSEAAVCAGALARALSAAKHRVTVLTLCAEERAAAIPGMARRLRTVQAQLADGDRECALFEGRSAVSQCALHALGVEPTDRGHTAAFLASAAAALVRDEICRPDAVIAWGEGAAAVLPAIQASARLFMLPSGSWGPPLTAAERAALNPNAPDLAMAKGSLAGLGAIDADVVVFPSPSSAGRFARAQEFSFRASDQPVVSVRLGSDEAPHDPSTDPALPATYSADAPAGKADCRKAVARRASLALGPRTLLVTTVAPTLEGGGRALVAALAALARQDVAIVVPDAGDRMLLDEIRRLAIQTPGKIALHPQVVAGSDRQLLAGADVMLLADARDHLARTAGLAMRYGTLPLAPDAAANRDYLIDLDPGSGTGSALLFNPDDAFEWVSVVLRAAALRGNPDLWRPLQARLMAQAPVWSATAELCESLCFTPSASA